MSVPFFTSGFTMLWTLFLISMTGMTFCKVMLLSTMVLLPLCHYRRLKTTRLVLAAMAFACFIFMLKTEVSYKPAVQLVSDFENTKVNVTGQIVETLPRSDSNSRRYIVQVESISQGEEAAKIPFGGLKILLSCKSFCGEVNDFISFESKLYVLNKSKKGCFVGTHLYDDANITSFEDVSTSTIQKVMATLRGKSQDIRGYTKSKLQLYLPDDYAGVVLGMLIGDKSELPQEYEDAFTKSGIVHLFSVSGFHVSLWSGVVYKRLLRSGLGKYGSCTISILFILMFMMVTGFSGSTVRAGIMMIVFYLGRMCYEDSDSLNSLGLSACIILISDPFAGGDVGFLLSFFSTLGIILGVRPIMKPVHKSLERISDFERRGKIADLLSGIVVSLCAFVFTFPLVAIFIGDVSLVAPITNLLTGSAASTMVFLSGLGVAISVLPIARMFCYPLFIAVGLLAKYISTVSAKLSYIPYAYVGADDKSMKAAIAAVLLLWGAALILPRSNNEKSDEDDLGYAYRERLTFWLSVIIILASTGSGLMIRYFRG